MKRKPKWTPLETVQDEHGQWYWRIVARNGNILCDGSEGYSRRSDMLRSFRSVMKLAAQALKELGP